MHLATAAVCPGHSPPAEFLAQQLCERPSLSLWQGPRGGGKSFISGLGCWLDSQMYDNHGTRILGGSLAQSGQIYEALRQFDRSRRGSSPLRSFSKTAATFRTGSEVSILAASPRAVRGPHVARLRLDEVDEIESDLRESAMGMCMSLRGVRASVVMTSTWHKVAGPMAELMEKGKDGAFPVSSFCMFEVLERCPEWRSGPSLEKCPECPLVQWCHRGRDEHPSGLPRAKRSNGHYTINALIQKLTLSARVFASDYLCEAPKAAGVWFKDFDARNVSESAEFDPALPVHVSIDSGVHTGAVFFQVREIGPDKLVSIFDEYYAYDTPAGEVAQAILRQLAARCGMASRRVSTDSAGGAKNPIGPTVIAEYQRAGLVGNLGLEHWPKYPGSVLDSLQLLEAFVRSADGSVGLTVHPRAKRTIDAFGSFQRAKKGGQYQDYPQEDNHPHEDMIDPIRGALHLMLPSGRRPEPKLRRVHARSLM